MSGRWVVLLGLLSTSLAWAAEYVLFDSHGFQVTDYNFIVSDLKPNDVLVFSDGKKVKIGRFLGAGGTTRVFELAREPAKVLRIPKARGPHDSSHSFQDFIFSYQDGWPTLNHLQVPTVHVYAEESVRGQYAVVEKIEAPLTFIDFLEDENLSTAQRRHMSDALVAFAKKTAVFARPGDFNATQILYDTRKRAWVLADWTSSHAFAAMTSLEAAKRADTIFIMGNDGAANPTQLFSKYTATQTDPEFGFLWKPKGSRNQWIADLANRLHHSILKERESMIRENRVPLVVPRRQPSCAAQYFQSVLGLID